MRFSPFTASLGVVPVALCLFPLIVGCAKPAPSPAVSTGTGVTLRPEHPVTPEMTRAAAMMDRKPAPAFERNLVQGGQGKISGRQTKPQFVLFILDSCPCSEEAQPIFNALSKHWQDKVQFVGVIDSPTEKAKKWLADYHPAFPVISDPKKEIIKAYRAKQSVYSVLISKEGQIVKLWPGYSVDLLAEMNKAIAKELGEEPLAFDAQYAPKKKTSGCYF